MSELPPHPNLEYLKKQAKDKLATLRPTSPSARLADAQHAIAAEYGFASWAALKAHVALATANFHFERYTIDAKRVLYFARDEACKGGSRTIEPEHVVLGLVREGRVTLEQARAQIPLGAKPRPLLPQNTKIPFSDETLRLLKRLAAAGTREITVAHLASITMRA